ncbi:MAG: DUF600 family protein [Spirosomataceae bacterium]
MTTSINELIEKMAFTMIDTSLPDDWTHVSAIYFSVVRYSRLGIYYYQLDNNEGNLYYPGDELPYSQRPFSLFTNLRQEMAKINEGKGAWYIAKMEIQKNGKFNIQFDYDNKPDLSFEIPDEVFIEDFEQFPRDEKYIPDWLREILVRYGKL